MLKVVFDTNIFISAFLFPGGKPEKAYRLAVRRKINLFTSPAIIREVADKLRTKFQVEEENIVDILKQIARISEIVKPSHRLKLLRDDPDNRILECTLEAKANLIVSGDKHLLNLKNYENIPIIRASDLIYTLPQK